MQSQKTHINNLLNFSRWSRKAYAAFISIGKIVKISTLKIEVAQSFIKKSKSFIEIHDFLSLNKDNIDKEQEHTIKILNPIVLLAIKTQTKVFHSDNLNNTNFYKEINIKRELLFALFYLTKFKLILHA